VCRFEPPAGVFDCHRTTALDIESGPLLEALEGEQVRRRRGLALGRISSADDHGKQRAQPGGIEDLVDLVTQRARGDGDRHGCRRLANEPLRAAKEHVAAVQHLLQLVALQGDHLGDRPRAGRQRPVARQRLEHSDVVVAEITRVILFRGQRDAVLGERFLERSQMKRLAVGNDTVEVEHDGL
jgi:hypothetical protein